MISLIYIRKALSFSSSTRNQLALKHCGPVRVRWGCFRFFFGTAAVAPGCRGCSLRLFLDCGSLLLAVPRIWLDFLHHMHQEQDARLQLLSSKAETPAKEKKISEGRESWRPEGTERRRPEGREEDDGESVASDGGLPLVPFGHSLALGLRERPSDQRDLGFAPFSVFLETFLSFLMWCLVMLRVLVCAFWVIWSCF